jgi:DNA-binding transcriptional ArsR family regulator
LYLLIGLPLGILDFTIMVTGLSLGLGLIITIIGIPVLVAALLVSRSLATMERELARSLLDAPMPRRRAERDSAGGLFWARLRSLVVSKCTWTETGFLLLRLSMGILDFTVAVTIISLALSGPGETIAVAAGGATTLGSWKIDTFVESLVFWPVSAVFLLVGPRLMLAWSELSGHLATSLLGRLDPYEMKLAVIEVLARLDEADGFRILDELALRLGRGSFLTPTRLEATLLALESTGYVSTRQVGERTVYTLTGDRKTETVQM